jgi:sugar phosphate permease
VVGDICGGLFSDMIIHRTGRIKFARQSVAIVGFLIAAACCPLAVLEPDRYLSAGLFGLTVFGLELVVGNAWAVTLDIGGNFAGSCSAVMNTAGNIGGAIMATVTVFIVSAWGWNSAFYAVSVLSVMGALLFTQIDAGRKLVPDGTNPVV